ncbi:hypothetical protein PSHT_08932 [Puccinia striiformis]|uniref:Secreted protein n=1 Tax=Puccinia striiformis TaxID=27350 RepID=A0A2S4VJU4_9BASI|nr:hypothetical protein PSHT_08932 [Puccinia striiformis]
MIRQLLVLLILIIGQCIIAMELPKVVEASENPLHGIDTPARISELHSAPDPPSSNQLSTSSAPSKLWMICRKIIRQDWIIKKRNTGFQSLMLCKQLMAPGVKSV